MKKLVLVFGLVAVFALASVASAATLAELQAQLAQIQAAIAALSGTSAPAGSVPTITASLTIGSRGDQVSDLQKYLEDEGFLVMPVGVDYGYFGPLTQKAIADWQRANGVSPAAGYFGPISRAKLAELGTTAPVTTTPTTPAIVADGTDGSLSYGESAEVSTGNTVRMGETKNVFSARLQATAGRVVVSRVDVKFSDSSSVRPWSTLSRVILKDATGNVLAERAITGSSDFTEITAGSDYRLRFDGLNYTVNPGTDAHLVVAVTVRTASNHVGTQTITVSIPNGGIRTVNGKGYTDSLGNDSITKNFVLTGTLGSAANIFTRLSPNSPLARIAPISATQPTSDVVLGIYGLKSENTGSKVNAMNFTVQTDPSWGNVTTLLSSLRLRDGDRTYGATSFNNAGLATFTNLNIDLTQDVWKDLTLLMNVNATSSAVKASSTMVASSITGIDTNDNALTISGGNQTGSNVTLSANAISVSNMSVANDAGIPAVANGPVVKYPVRYSFTLTNNGSNDLFVSKDAALLVGTTTVPAANASSTLTSISPVAAIANDTPAAYVLSSNGGSRTFTLNGTIGRSSNASNSETLTITQINYGTASGSYGQSINFGLETLSRNFAF